MDCIPQENNLTQFELSRRARFRRAALVTAGILTVGVAIAACGGPSTPGAATGSTTTTSVSASAGAGTDTSKLVAYSSCMRSHGIPSFPDPSSNGGISKQSLISAEGGVSNSQVQTATNACQSLLVAAGDSLSGEPVQTIPTQDQQDYLNAVACLHSHGITAFPEPIFSGGQVEFPMLEHLVDLNSPQVKQALQICQKLIPPGLPDSGSGG
ncbi:MAG TPA: hypothetical protein VGG38_13010 [Acidimicrobiales bacterium]|jgi:hypothetical protein